MPLRERIRYAKRYLKGLVYGMLYHQLYLDTVKHATSYKDFFLFILYGELLGVPLLSNIYTLRTLPYIVGELYGWKTRLLRDRDPTDEAPDIG